MRSHSAPSRFDWKMSERPSAEKYASAFSPPLVNCRTLRRCFSAGGSTGEGLLAGLWAAENAAAESPKRRARGNSIFVLIILQGKSVRDAKGNTDGTPLL